MEVLRCLFLTYYLWHKYNNYFFFNLTVIIIYINKVPLQIEVQTLQRY